MEAQISKPKKPKHPAIIYLSRYAALKLRREDLKEELLMIRENATRATSRYTAERMSGTGKKDGMANAAVKAVEVEQRLERTIANLAEALNARLFIIEQMQDEWEKVILTERYINGREWDAILKRIPFERTAMFELHGRALQHFWDIYTRKDESADLNGLSSVL